MTKILAIDPGPTRSAWLLFDGGVFDYGHSENEAILQQLRTNEQLDPSFTADLLVVESMRPRGQPTSLDEMNTLIWIGRFIQQWPGAHELIPRDDVKLIICGTRAARDANVRQALIDQFGGDEKAVGGKKCPKCKGKGWIGRDHEPCDKWLHPPGPLHGISGHVWSALAVAVAWSERARLEALSKERRESRTFGFAAKP